MALLKFIGRVFKAIVDAESAMDRWGSRNGGRAVLVVVAACVALFAYLWITRGL